MAGGNAFGVVASLAALAALGGVVWQASELKQDYDRQLEQLDDRLATMEAVSPENEGSSVLRRITALERQVNDLNSASARQSADIAQIEGSASGLGGQLAERVNALEQAVALKETDNSPEASGLVERLDFIEQRLAAMGATSVEGARQVSVSGAGPALVNTDFRADVQGLDFRLVECRGRSAPVCRFTIENTTNRDISVNIEARNSQSHTHAFDQNSQLLVGTRARIGPNEASDVRFNTPPGLRVDGELRFDQSNQQVQYFQILRVDFDSPRQTVEFRNVPVE